MPSSPDQRVSEGQSARHAQEFKFSCSCRQPYTEKLTQLGENQVQCRQQCDRRRSPNATCRGINC